MVIVVSEAMIEQRRSMGWTTEAYPGIDSCTVYIHPDTEVIDKLLTTKQEESIHLFSGINAFPYISNVLKRSMHYNIKRGIITELPNTYAFGMPNGKPLWLHRLRFWMQDKKYAKHIHYCFAIGNKAVEYFNSVYDGWKVIPFAYCTKANTSIEAVESIKGECRLLFVGSLEWWKAVDTLLYAAKDIGKECSITIVGEGKERQKFERFIKKEGLQNVTFMGAQDNSIVHEEMKLHDVLILPSVYDGWGAVVNEALSEGMYAICSNACGAQEMLMDRRIGNVFDAGNVDQLKETLSVTINRLEDIRSNRAARKIWAKKNISGKVVAEYFCKALTENTPAQKPWNKKLS